MKKNFSKMTFSISLFLILTSFLATNQPDRRTTLLNQANQLVARRNFERANSIYRNLLDENPNDHTAAAKLIESYFQTSKIEEAAELIQEYEDIFPKNILIRLHATLVIKQGKAEEAYDEVMEYLDSISQNMNRYREMALLFQKNKQYEYAINIFEKMREISNDKQMNARDLANNYQYLGQYDNAISEYVKYLEKNRSYRYYIFNRIKSMLDQDPTIVKVLRKEFEQTNNENIAELYAKSLAYVGENEKALQIYSKLDVNLLRLFAEAQFREGNYSLSKKAFEIYISQEKSVTKKAEAMLTLADVYERLGNLEKSEEILLKIYDNKTLQKRSNYYKSRANSRSRQKLAELSIKMGRDKKIVLKYLEEAGSFALNGKEKQMIELEKVDYLILRGDFKEAEEELARIKTASEIGTEIDKMSRYYDFLLAFYQTKPTADSLLTEVMISTPENKDVNDIFLLKEIADQMDESQKESLLKAFRLKNIYAEEKAVTLLDSIKKSTTNEYISILQGLWANSQEEINQMYFEKEFDNEVLNDVAAYFQASIEADPHIKQIMAQEYLKNHPNSVFAPQFRELLK
ncbi:MAG: tetratricopeptide repeat protein [Candidatus Cloacimonadota bacterium]|nr:tetratricopeptide repeat protein [Candidatus Cloacimonadota bacterium]